MALNMKRCTECKEPITSIMMLEGRGPEFYCVRCVRSLPIEAAPRKHRQTVSA